MSVVWKLRLWDNAAIQGAMLAAYRVGMGGDEIGDLSNRPTDDSIAATLRKSMPDRPAQAIHTFIGYWRSFLDKMQPADYVLCPLVERRFAVARVQGGYEFMPDERLPELRHTRRVEWVTPPLARSRLSEPLLRAVQSPGTIGVIHYPGAVPEVEQLVRDHQP